MDDKLVTTEKIMDYFTEKVSQKEPIAPYLWLEGALKLSVLIGEDQNKLFNLNQKVAQGKETRIRNGENVSRARSFVETTDEYVEACKLKAKIERAWEFIKCAKLYSRLSQDEMRGQL